MVTEDRSPHLIIILITVIIIIPMLLVVVVVVEAVAVAANPSLSDLVIGTVPTAVSRTLPPECLA